MQPIMRADLHEKELIGSLAGKEIVHHQRKNVDWFGRRLVADFDNLITEAVERFADELFGGGYHSVNPTQR
jgi:hypothetical protein